MIKNIVFMLIGGFIATAILTVIAMWQTAKEEESWEEELMEDMYEEQDMQQEREENGVQ